MRGFKAKKQNNLKFSEKLVKVYFYGKKSKPVYGYTGFWFAQYLVKLNPDKFQIAEILD